MIKKLCIASLAVILIVNAVGCDSDINTEYPWSITKSNMDIKNENEYIVIQFADDTLTTKGAQLTLYNNSEKDISFGSEYFIQIYRNNSWYDIEIGDVDWTGELVTVESNREYTVEFDWNSIYGELPSGRYRIVKEYKQANQPYFSFCEFEIP